MAEREAAREILALDAAWFHAIISCGGFRVFDGHANEGHGHGLID